MKSAGIIRRLDELGRIVLPIEMRRSLDWEDRARIIITAEGDRIVLKKYEESCCFCGGEGKNLKEFRGKLVCAKCIQKLREL